MKLIDKISVIKMSDISHDDLKLWLIEEITDLCNDMGQKLDEDQKQHVPNRLFYILIEKYRNWEPGKIHSIFQKGIAGSYGRGIKITVALLLNWITQEDKLAKGENVHGYMPDEEITSDQKQHYEETFQRCYPFINFCHTRGIDISGLERDDYYRLRNRYNKGGESEIMADIAKLPQYKNFGTAKLIKL
jgi:hypothetical protein